MSVDCLYGHARDRDHARAYTCACTCARAHTCACTCARARARPQVVQPEFHSNTESSCWVELLMRFVEPAVEPAGRPRQHYNGRVVCFRDLGVNKSNTRDILT